VTDQMRPDPADDVIATLARQLDAAQRAVGTGDDGDPLGALARALVALSEVPGGPAGPAAPSTIRRGEAIEAIAAGLADVAARLDAQREAVATGLTALSEAVDRVAAGRHRHTGLERELDALHDRFARAERHGSRGDPATTTSCAGSRRWRPPRPPAGSSPGSPPRRSRRRSGAAPRHWPSATPTSPTPSPAPAARCWTWAAAPATSWRWWPSGAWRCAASTPTPRPSTAPGPAASTQQVGDGLAELAALEPASLGALACIQVVEHLSAGQLVELVARAAEVVRPGGLVVAETVNPGSLYVYGHALYLDPTHTTPIHPAYLAFCFEQAGFAKVDVQMRSEPPADERLPRVEGSEAGP
jgi:hypothetical protein